MSCRITIESRKPSVYHVLNSVNHGALLANDPKATRAGRWRMLTDWGDGMLSTRTFPSKRAALYFFEYGKTFKTKVIFSVIGGRKSQKRIR